LRNIEAPKTNKRLSRRQAKDRKGIILALKDLVELKQCCASDGSQLEIKQMMKN
jgi:hypothetical protein